MTASKQPALPPLDLEALKALCERATNGPWRVRPLPYDDWGWIRGPDNNHVAHALSGSMRSEDGENQHRRNGTDPFAHNAAFISAAREALPLLIEEVEKLRGALDGIRLYGADTLDGPIGVPDDREWQREGVVEMTRRAAAALSGAPK